MSASSPAERRGLVFVGASLALSLGSLLLAVSVLPGRWPERGAWIASVGAIVLAGLASRGRSTFAVGALLFALTVGMLLVVVRVLV